MALSLSSVVVSAGPIIIGGMLCKVALQRRIHGLRWHPQMVSGVSLAGAGLLTLGSNGRYPDAELFAIVIAGALNIWNSFAIRANARLK